MNPEKYKPLIKNTKTSWKIDEVNTREEVDYANAPKTTINRGGDIFESDRSQEIHDISHMQGRAFVLNGLRGTNKKRVLELMREISVDIVSITDFTPSGEMLPDCLDDFFDNLVVLEIKYGKIVGEHSMDENLYFWKLNEEQKKQLEDGNYLYASKEGAMLGGVYQKTQYIQTNFIENLTNFVVHNDYFLAKLQAKFDDYIEIHPEIKAKSEKHFPNAKKLPFSFYIQVYSYNLINKDIEYFVKTGKFSEFFEFFKDLFSEILDLDFFEFLQKYIKTLELKDYLIIGDLSPKKDYVDTELGYFFRIGQKKTSFLEIEIAKRKTAENIIGTSNADDLK